MSFLLDFSEDGIIKNWRVARSQISSDRRLTYDEADQLIAGTSQDTLSQPLKKLSALSKQIAAGRHSEGALTINRPELKIQVENDQIDIKVLDVASPGRRLVSEMMILANSLAAAFASEEKVPIIFRAQNPPAAKLAAPEEYDPVALDSLFQKLEPGRLSIYPQPHASLGLASYTQLTSPIRRFTDLVIQRQLAAHLANHTVPYELQELMNILATVQASESNVRALERRARRLFVLKHLAKLDDSTFEVVVIKKQAAGYLVETQDLYVRGQLIADVDYEPGQIVKAITDSIEPDKGIFRLRPLNR